MNKVTVLMEVGQVIGTDDERIVQAARSTAAVCDHALRGGRREYPTANRLGRDAGCSLRGSSAE